MTFLGMAESAASVGAVPGLFWTWPFVALLLAIALLPLFRSTEHWWHKNANKLLIAVSLGLITLAYYWLRGFGVGHDDHVTPAGLPTVLAVLNHALYEEYLPFILLLF